ncbi:Calx-beta domain-containing protein, partial [Aquimarina algicola]|uniref:Calx-beta domain-containing protein n=1 Tax=Aquimarina algicola TaxID=2589995 RepID=UPI0021D3AFCD
MNTTGSAIVIPVVMSGTATDGTDYTSIVNITIPNGSDTGTVAVDAATDGLIEGDETAIASLGTLPSGVVAGTSTSDTVTISDATEYTVNLTASVDTAVEGGTDGEFTATLNAVNTTGSAIVIPVVMSGTATDGTDYTSIVNITIPNGSDTGAVAVDAATDGLIEGDETAIASLGTLPSGVVAGTSTSDTVTISDA